MALEYLLHSVLEVEAEVPKRLVVFEAVQDPLNFWNRRVVELQTHRVLGHFYVFLLDFI